MSEATKPGSTPIAKEGYATITEKIASVVLHHPTGPGWLALFLVSFSFFNLMLVSIVVTLVKGVGMWGVQVPVAWGFAITNFVWWIGIGHAGTLISAILLLLKQGWRTSINRFAEAMTLFAVSCAGLFPLLHLGRPQFFYYLVPYPDTMGLWPQWRSALVWDIFAVFTYFTVSLLFWYTGLVPDLATMRDRAKKRWVKVVYGVLALGWRGSAEHWERYELAYLLLAGLATPLVVSVHTVVSFDFAIAQLPGWHSTIFPPYFVAGAIFSGFAMVLMLAIPMRWYYGLEEFITPWHLEASAKVMLATGLIVGYGYLMEVFMAFYSGDWHEWSLWTWRALHSYQLQFWAMITFNVLTTQLLWFKKVRRTPWALFIVACALQTGMWLERYVIVIASLSHGYLISSWRNYKATFWDWGLFTGTMGFFLTAFLLFIRFMPSISMAELREEAHKDLEASL